MTVQQRSAGAVERPLWFGPPARRRFGWLTEPDGGSADGRPTNGGSAYGGSAAGSSPAGGLAVVLCPPIGEEARCAHRTFRVLGQALARRGMTALRVDYDGTGDSVGAQDDPDRLAAWQASVADAVALLRSSGHRRVALVGMRLGALLAGQTAASDGSVAGVVLWDPCTSGRAFLREGRALHNTGDHLLEDPADGSVITPGFAYDRATAAAVGALRLADIPRPSCATLLLTRTGGAPPRAAGAQWRGDDVERATAAGQPALLEVEPNQATVPSTTLADVADWLRRLSTDAPRPQPSGLVATDTADTVDPAALGAADEAQWVDPATGVTVREHAVALGPAGVFGIVTTPATGSSGPWIVLVNTGVELHIGPGRRWVDFARAWAARGFRCVRIDQSGVGDSPCRPGQGEDLLFDAHWLQDLPDVIDALPGPTAPVVLFGLCSGAYSGFEAALRRRVDAVYAINPRVSVPEMSRISAAWDPERQIARPLASPITRITQYNSRLAWALWRIWRQAAVGQAPMAAVHAVLRTGATVRLVGNDKDTWGFREVPWWTVVRRSATVDSGRYTLVVDDHVDHAMMTQRAQRAVLSDATDWLLARYRDALPQATPAEAEVGSGR